MYTKLMGNELTEKIIGSAIEVHRAIGPGLLETVYEECLCHELRLRNIPFERQLALPVEYKGIKLDCAYRIDVVVANEVVLEIKSLDGLLPIHKAQIMTYMKLGGWKLGLLLNFNVSRLVNGIERIALGFKE